LGRPTAWVAERLEAALRHDAEASFFLVLSRGTTHRPAPRNAAGYAIDEAAASAKYLIDRGVDPSRVLLVRTRELLPRLSHTKPRPTVNLSHVYFSGLVVPRHDWQRCFRTAYAL